MKNQETYTSYEASNEEIFFIFQSTCSHSNLFVNASDWVYLVKVFSSYTFTRILKFKTMVVSTFLETSLKVIICQSLKFLYKLNNAGEDMWLQTETANEKLKHDTQAQDTCDMQAKSVFYMTQLEALPQPRIYFIGGYGRGSDPLAPARFR